MSDLVIDASVAVKWVIEEEGTKEAFALRGRALAAPDLLTAECANILWKKVRCRELSEREAAFAAALLARADIELGQCGLTSKPLSGSPRHSITPPMTASASHSPKPKGSNLLPPTRAY